MKKFEETVKANPSHHSGRPGATAITCDHRSSVQSAGDSNSCGLSCRLVLDSIREPMCLVNHEGRVIDCNSPACSLLGLKRNHLLSSVLPALAPNAISDKSKNIFVDIIEHLETFQKFFYFNGRKYQSTYIPVATTSDKIDCVSVVCQDISDTGKFVPKAHDQYWRDKLSRLTSKEVHNRRRSVWKGGWI